MKVLRLLLVLLLLSSCASYLKRKECEKTNWFEYGKSFALKGQRLDASEFVKQCQEVEAKIDHAGLDVGFKAGMKAYCTDENAYKVGYEGENMSYDFCDSNQKPSLTNKFNTGRNKLCSSGGYEFGSRGKVYAGQCNNNKEEAFLVEYKKGRAKYLKSEISIARQKILGNEDRMRQIQFQLLGLQSNLSSLGSGRVLVRERRYDEFSKKYIEETRWKEDEATAQRRADIQHQISVLQSESSRLSQDNKALNEEMDRLRRELVVVEQ